MKILAVESIRKRNLNSVHGKFEILEHMRSHNLTHTNMRIFPFNLKIKRTSGTTWKCFQGQQPSVRGRKCTACWQKQSVTLSKTVPFSLLLSSLLCPHLPSAYGLGVATQSNLTAEFQYQGSSCPLGAFMQIHKALKWTDARWTLVSPASSSSSSAPQQLYKPMSRSHCEWVPLSHQCCIWS